MYSAIITFHIKRDKAHSSPRIAERGKDKTGIKRRAIVSAINWERIINLLST